MDEIPVEFLLGVLCGVLIGFGLAPYVEAGLWALG